MGPMKRPDLRPLWPLAAVVIAAPALAETAEEERNATAIRRHHEAINARDLDTAARGYAEQVTNNGNPVDRARIRAILADNATTFPDWTMRIDRLIARGDEVVALMTVSGTHLGTSQRPVNGGVYLGVAPTGKRFAVLHTHWFRMQDGLIVEHRATRDDLGMSRQLGLLPPGPPRPPDRTP
jgi:predicted ester cyclase